jgi:hypothetical protein
MTHHEITLLSTLVLRHSSDKHLTSGFPRTHPLYTSIRPSGSITKRLSEHSISSFKKASKGSTNCCNFMMGVIPNNTRHPLVLLCAFIIGLAHSFAPNKVLSSPSLLRLSHPQQKWCRTANINDCVVRFASSLPADDSLLMTPQGTFTESPVLVFQQLAVVGDTNNDSPPLVGMEELKQWGELQDLLSDEEIESSELEDMFAEITKATGATNNGKLDKAGFVLLYKAIDNLFVYEDDTDEGEIMNVGGGNDSAAVDELTGSVLSEDQRSLPDTQEELLSLLSDIQSVPNKLPCGMDCTDKEREIIAKIVSDLEAEPNNLVLKNNGKIATTDLIGDWDLLYTNSKGIIMNKSLSGLSSEKAKFSGVRQRLTGSK